MRWFLIVVAITLGSCEGSTGPQGPPGDSGTQGLPGVSGVRGPQGSTGFSLQIRTGVISHSNYTAGDSVWGSIPLAVVGSEPVVVSFSLRNPDGTYRVVDPTIPTAVIWADSGSTYAISGTRGWYLLYKDSGNTLLGMNYRVNFIQASEITVQLPDGVLMELVWVEPGTFVMGQSTLDTENVEWDRDPPHQVTITRGFYIGKYEITKSQWTAVMGTRPWAGYKRSPEGPDYPATVISWDDIQLFIQRLNETVGDSLYRLPTEAEWEYTCRAGTTTWFSFGDSIGIAGDYAWTSENSSNHAHQVGTKLPNPWGVYDMHGNVWEWCQDYYDPDYPSEDQVDPTGPEPRNSSHVIRGGEFDSPLGAAASSYRDGLGSFERVENLGTRVVMRVSRYR